MRREILQNINKFLTRLRVIKSQKQGYEQDHLVVVPRANMPSDDVKNMTLEELAIFLTDEGGSVSVVELPDGRKLMGDELVKYINNPD